MPIKAPIEQIDVGITRPVNADFDVQKVDEPVMSRVHPPRLARVRLAYQNVAATVTVDSDGLERSGMKRKPHYRAPKRKSRPS